METRRVRYGLWRLAAWWERRRTGKLLAWNLSSCPWSPGPPQTPDPGSFLTQSHRPTSPQIGATVGACSAADDKKYLDEMGDMQLTIRHRICIPDMKLFCITADIYSDLVVLN